MSRRIRAGDGYWRGVVLSAGATFLAVSCAARPAQQTCLDVADGIILTADSMGSVGLWRPLAELEARCPEMTETRHTTAVDAVPLPALRLVAGPLEAVAVQHGPGLNRGEPPAFWVISGGGARLPGGVPIEAQWSDLRDAYGPAVGSTESGETRVRFERHPRLLFTLDADPESVGSLEVTGDLSTIPSTARVASVLIGPPAGR